MRARLSRAVRVVPTVLMLWAALMLLSWCVSVRLPAETPARAWLLPSPEIAALLALFALFAPHPDWRLPRGLGILLCATLLALRFGRVADGICLRYFDRRFHLAADLPLVPELGRLALSTLGPLKLALAVSGLVVAGVLVWHVCGFALCRLARALSSRAIGNAYLTALGALGLSGALLVPSGLFASPVSPRVMSELEVWLTARGMFDDPERAAQRRVFNARFEERQALLRAAPTDLDLTGGVDVHILLIEAYGRVALSNSVFAERLAPSYQALAAAAAQQRYFTCSMLVRATVYGGNSWMTHATLQSAVPIGDQFEYGLLMERPRIASLAQSFRRAGYRTISIKPGTTRDAPHTRIYGFDREYNAPDLGYRGPTFAWAPMPDQFVLQRIAELELVRPTQPLFLEYALVSSHFPFDPHPPYVEDWSSLGDGSIYHRLQPVRVNDPGSGQHVSELGWVYVLGYLSSLSYDLRVIGDYIKRYVRGDGLVLVLGDHQPIAPVAGEDRSRATPLHVFSRRDALLDPFRARGCQPGLIPRVSEPQVLMEDIGIDLLHGLNGQAGAPK
jgi:hypothetical protein